jgi:RNA polymerase sigma-70 factor (ECF subfamily)
MVVIALLLGALLPRWRRESVGAPAPDEAASNLDLVRAAAEGDRRAFDELYRAHVGSAYRLLTRLVGPVPERDDLIQQVFLEAFRALPRFRGEASFGTWLHRIVVRLAYRHLRRQRRAAWDEVPEELAAATVSPEHAARRQEELRRALAYLALLKPKKRIAYVLRVVEGMSLEEIGELVGANAPAVGQRVKHAQRELAAMVDRDRRRTMEVS